MKKLNLRNELINREVSLTANSDVEQVIVDTAVAKGMDTSFLFVFLDVAEKHPPKLSEEDEAMYLAVTIAKLSLAWLCYTNKDTAYTDIAKRIQNDGDHAWFNNFFWGRRRLHAETIRVLAKVWHGPSSSDDEINGGGEIYTLVRFIVGGATGKEIATLLTTTYEGYISGTISLEDATREFASNSTLARVIFSTLDLNAHLSQRCRQLIDSHHNSGRAVAVTYGQVIIADNLEEAKEKLDAALKEFAVGLQQQLEDKWGK